MEGRAERSHTFTGIGSSPEATVQDCTYNVVAYLRCRYSELNNSYTFAYFPYQVRGSVNEVRYPHPIYDEVMESWIMSELIRALDVN
jgi:hypothetical protein